MFAKGGAIKLTSPETEYFSRRPGSEETFFIRPETRKETQGNDRLHSPKYMKFRETNPGLSSFSPHLGAG